MNLGDSLDSKPKTIDASATIPSGQETHGTPMKCKRSLQGSVSLTATDPSPRGTVLGLALIITAYLCASLLLVHAKESPIVDEPIFASSALEFARSGQIQISNLSAPNAVFDTVWGGLFAIVFGETYEALRISTIVLVTISGLFVYLMCRTLGGSRRSSVLGVAAYHFAPLSFPLSVTFQTDSRFLALIVMAMSVIAYGLTRETHQIRFLLIGSGFTALAFLSRPQALVITIAAVLVWLLGKQENRGRVKGVVALTTLPFLTYAAHELWTSAAGEPYIRELYGERLLALNPKTYLAIGAQGLTDAPVYLSLFALPFLPLLVAGVRRGLRNRRRLAIYLAAALGTITLTLLGTRQGPLFEGTWVRTTGLAGVDGSFLGSPTALPFLAVAALVVASVISGYSLILSPSLREQTRANRQSFYFVTLTLVGFVAGAIIATLGAHPRILDRYWLPMVPLVIALAASAAQITRTRLLIAWSLVTVLGLVSVVGTVDGFNTYRAANDFADDIVSDGISPLALDGGASWAAATFGLNDDDPEYLYRPGPFWIKFYAVESDPEYGIALEPLEGYTVLERRKYRSLLHPGPDYLYLVHRDPALPFYIRQSDL